jgi:hypothetical protein
VTPSWPGLIEGLVPVGVRGCSCSECRRQVDRLGGENQEAIDRAEALLARFLTTRQLRQWKRDQRIVVRGSNGTKFQLTPRDHGRHSAVVAEDGLGIAVWPTNLAIAADWALALMLELQADQRRVVGKGCHDYGHGFAESTLA